MEFCNQCPNKCPKNNLKCGRGQAYFNGENYEKSSESRHHRGIRKSFHNHKSDNELVKLLTTCGMIANHRSEKMLEHNIDESVMFEVLTDNEQEILKNLLTKLNNKWEEDHKKHHH
ncbi:MAG: hypothetical protein ACI4IR_04520 [Eubacterium sp.]